MKHSGAVKREEASIVPKNAAAKELFTPQDIGFEFWTEKTIKKMLKEAK